MYYINKEVSLNTGVKYSTYSIHVISHLHIDYVHREISATLCSYKNMKDLASNFLRNGSGVELCSNYFNFKYDNETFDIDPSLFSFRILIATEDSPFHGAEIRKMYDEASKLSELLPPLLDGDTQASHTSSVAEEYVDNSHEQDLSGEFVISNVAIGSVK